MSEFFNMQLQMEVSKIREKLQEMDNLSSFAIDIEIRGRVHDGDVKIEFKVGEQYSSASSAIGNNLDVVCEEFMRRFGWEKRNAPLMLSSLNKAEPIVIEQPPTISTEDDLEIPF